MKTNFLYKFRIYRPYTNCLLSQSRRLHFKRVSIFLGLIFCLLFVEFPQDEEDIEIAVTEAKIQKLDNAHRSLTQKIKLKKFKFVTGEPLHELNIDKKKMIK